MGGWDGVGKKGDGLGSFLLKFGETVKQSKEQLMMIGFCVQNIVSFQKCNWQPKGGLWDCLKAVSAWNLEAKVFLAWA